MMLFRDGGPMQTATRPAGELAQSHVASQFAVGLSRGIFRRSFTAEPHGTARALNGFGYLVVRLGGQAELPFGIGPRATTV